VTRTLRAVGTLVTLDLPPDSPMLVLPWIVTFGPLTEEGEWEPVVCGPYERPHAMSLAEEVVADDDLMAVVEPLVPHVSADDIRQQIETARAGSPDGADDWYEDGDLSDEDELAALDHQRTGPPSPEEIRAGFARIARALAAG
jgi:hypothetical protein